MKKIKITVLLLLFLGQNAYSQQNDKLHDITLSEISQVNQGNSYITFPIDLGNIEPLWFEGNIIPNFNIRKSKNSRLMGVLTPQIIMRMYRKNSFPVQTPSYIPQITVYYQIKNQSHSRTQNIYLRLAQHSNGQEDSFFMENGDINLKSGDFSTNFIEPGYILTNINKRLNAYQFFKTSLEIHPPGMISDELVGIYSQVNWHNTLSIFKLPVKDKANPDKSKAAISLKAETTWKFGNYNGLNNYSLERLNLKLTFYYHPEFLEEVGLFVQYYHGSDYYNVYFNHRLDVIRFGLMTDKLRF